MFANSYLNYRDISDRHKKVIGYTFGSCVAEFVVSPIYMVKTRYQTCDLPIINKSVKLTYETNDINKLNEIIKEIYHADKPRTVGELIGTMDKPQTINEIAKEIYNTKGIRGFYNAIYTAIFAKILSSSLKFLIYNELKHIRGTQNNDLKNNIINGCICGISSSAVVHPMDVLTNRLQRFKKLRIDILERKTLYAGFSQTIIKNLTLYSILFPLFDYNKTLTNDDILLSCVMTCCVSSTVLQPIEYLRTRLMAKQHIEVRHIFETRNYKQLFRGWRISIIANIMHFTIAMQIAHMF